MLGQVSKKNNLMEILFTIGYYRNTTVTNVLVMKGSIEGVEPSKKSPKQIEGISTLNDVEFLDAGFHGRKQSGIGENSY